MTSIRKPTHPGEILREEVLIPLGLSITEAASKLGVTRKALSELINCRSALSPLMALRIAKATNTSSESWMNLQTKLDLWKAEQQKLKVLVFPGVASIEDIPQEG